MYNKKCSIMKISRHRMGSDGKGVSTLIGFAGCPLHCAYCLNDFCHDENAAWKQYNPQELMDQVRIDDFFFRMTGGGIVFGGGEPILHSEFISAFIGIAPKEWDFRIETSLNCSSEHVNRLIPHIDQWIIDVKDMNPEIYERYTGISNQKVCENIKLICENAARDKIVFRVPHIPGYNTESDVQKSVAALRECGEIDVFQYRIDK